MHLGKIVPRTDDGAVHVIVEIPMRSRNTYAYDIEHFFAVYKELEGKKVTACGWQGARHAERALGEAMV